MPRLLLAASFASLLFACSTAGRDGDDPPACGDAVKEGDEQCDDGNLINGDGCSGACKMEMAAGCGDGNLAAPEECDDGNTTGGDGCSATCGMENGAGGTCSAPHALAPMDNGMGVMEATGSGDTTSSTDQVEEGACDDIDSGAGNDHVWKFTLAVASDVVVMTDETTTFDSVLRVMTSPCDITTEISEYGTEDGCSDNEGAAEFLGYVRLQPGTYYVVVDGYSTADAGQYSFSYFAWPTTCGDGVVDELEFCDDGNSAAADGCSAKCEVETGYICDDGEPSVCTGGSTSAMPPAPGDLVLNEYMAADNTSDTNCDGVTTGTEDEFVEIVNVSNKTLDLANVTISDSVTMRHTFAAGTQLPPGQAFVVWNAGAPACPGVTRFAVASSGQLGLNDAGDTISVELGATSLLSYTFGAATTNVSANLSPELTGTTYVLHNAMSGAMGAWSPGKRADGSAF
jgi:cysteine-rich repeat protein